MRPRTGAAPFSLLRLLLAASLALTSLAPLSAFFAPAAVAASAPLLADETGTESETADQQVAATMAAFDALMDHFVHPLSSSDLLAAAWYSLGTEAQKDGAPAIGPLPPLTGDRAADAASFRSAFQAYMNRQSAFPDGFVPRQAAVAGMVSFAHEGHTYALSVKQFADFETWSRGQDTTYVGIGVTVQPANLTTGTRITRILAGSPAEASGLETGDVIVAVDGTDISNLPPDQTTNLIRGPEGSTVDLLVSRAGQPDPLEIPVQRQLIDVPFVTHRMLDATTGYVSLASFPDTSIVNLVQQALDDLTASGARSVVLDLRGNPGGNIFAGTRLLEHFVPAGTPIYRMLDRSGARTTGTTRGTAQWHQPLVVLVDGGSASMAEVFASAIQESHAGTIVGDRTSGNVAAGQVFPLGDGSAIQVTVSEILSGQGAALNQVGVEPDDVVNTDPADGPDGQDQALREAVQVLHSAVASTAAG